MTSLSEHESHPEIDLNSHRRSASQTDQSPSRPTVIQDATCDETTHVQEKPVELKPSDNASEETEETNANNAQNASPSIVNPAEGEPPQQDATETIVNHDGEDNRSRKYSNSKIKYTSIPPQQRAVYFTNDQPYGAMPYYYYPPAGSLEKPAPLMFISTQSPPGASSAPIQMSSSSSSSSTRENPPGNSTSVSPQNLPPRLRQASTAENEPTAPAASSSSSSQTTVPLAPVNGRRHRSILPRAYANFYSQHPPPPLMATPPGVVYSYPPIVHPAGPIAYNIRSADELEYFAYQQQCLGLPPPVVWSPASQASLSSNGLPTFGPYPMAGLPGGYMFNNPLFVQSTSSALNPEASEWVPSFSDPEVDPNENQILLDDEINFPPLNGAAAQNPPAGTVAVKDHPEAHAEPSDSPVENNPVKDHANVSSPVDATPVLSVSNSKVEATVTSISSQEETNTSKPALSASPSKPTPITYSTVILQTSDNHKATKTNTPTNPTQRRQQSSNPQINQLPSKDRPIQASQPQQQRTSGPTQSSNSRRRPPAKINGNASRMVSSSEASSVAKQQPPTVTDEWIEVKSKKTKKFDRITNDMGSERLIADEPVQQSASPISSLSSAGENTTTPLTSEDDFDEKDHRIVPVVTDNDVPTDYNQTIIDDVRRRLNQKELLLIIMRGCPGSGKSTLAKSLNYGKNGVILATDDYFTDQQTNQYIFDGKDIDDAHRYNRRRASDAFKRNISPIIIDNTNTQAWEMKPYVAMGQEAGYTILLVEPQTPWRYKARELSKRNRHDLPLKRIKDMLSRFEHDVTVQSIVDQLPVNNNNSKSSNHCPAAPEVPVSLPTDNDTIDPVSTSKKFYNTIDDSLILDDVRLCIKDMILLLTTQSYQTALSSYTSILTNTTTTTTTTSQSSTPLSMSFHDLSSLSPTSSLPSTPCTPHSRFHRPLTRFSSTATQDHSFNTEHLLRLPNTLTRCIDSLNTNQFTPTLSTQSSLIGKKRRKNKNKPSQESQSPTELLVNTNNNNNNMEESEETTSSVQQGTFNVFLAEDCTDFVVIDEQAENNWLTTVSRAFGIQINPERDHSTSLSQKAKPLPQANNCPLLDIIHHELNQPSTSSKFNSARSQRDVAIQCSSEDFNARTDHSCRILMARASTTSTVLPVIRPRPGYSECGIQVDLGDVRIDSLEHLIELYASLLSPATIRQFYDDCQSNIQWTRTHLDEYLQHRNDVIIVPTLQQLSLTTLNRWNEQIKSSNPTCNTISIDDLLQDINDDEEMNEDFILDEDSTDSNQMYLPWSIVHSLQELYGELPNTSFFESDHRGIALSIDDDLSISLYQALQRCVMEPPVKDSVTKPVIDNQMYAENKSKAKNQPSNNNQRWVIPSANASSHVSHSNSIPSLKQIIHEEQQAAKSQKTKQKRQLNYATEHKLKELEQQFPSFDADLLFDMFRENGYNYEITLVCISSMLDEEARIIPVKKAQPVLPARLLTTTKKVVEPVVDSYDVLRDDALRHAQRRKEFYAKANQANGHGMSGVASFYIHRASEEAQLMKDANRAACERLSRWRLADFQQTHKLDLHGLHVDEALQLFKQIEQDLTEGTRRTTPKSIEIITGYGKNSPYGGGYGKIRSAILSYIQQRSYRYSEPNKGVILWQLTNTRN